MGRLARSCGAAAVTIMAFAVASWVAGALVLPSVMHSPDIRWLVAAGLGALLGSRGLGVSRERRASAGGGFPVFAGGE